MRKKQVAIGTNVRTEVETESSGAAEWLTSIVRLEQVPFDFEAIEVEGDIPCEQS